MADQEKPVSAREWFLLFANTRTGMFSVTKNQTRGDWVIANMDEMAEVLEAYASSVCAAQQQRADQWERRAKRFQEGYNEVRAENTAYMIQEMQWEAETADKVLRERCERLKGKLVAEATVRRTAEAELTAARQRIEELERYYPYTPRTLEYRTLPPTEIDDSNAPKSLPQICNTQSGKCRTATEDENRIVKLEAEVAALKKELAELRKRNKF